MKTIISGPGFRVITSNKEKYAGSRWKMPLELDLCGGLLRFDSFPE